jgi:hypothetical protein
MAEPQEPDSQLKEVLKEIASSGKKDKFAKWLPALFIAGIIVVFFLYITLF